MTKSSAAFTCLLATTLVVSACSNNHGSASSSGSSSGSVAGGGSSSGSIAGGGSSSGASAGSSSGGTALTGFACTTANLYAGNPKSATSSNSDNTVTTLPFKPTAAAETLDVHQLLFSMANGSPYLFTYDGAKRLWGAKLDDASVVFNKIAGSTTNGDFQGGPCSNASIRLGDIHGIAAVPGATDGTFVAVVHANSDDTKGALIEVKNPQSLVDCSVNLISANALSLSNPVWPIFVGTGLYVIQRPDAGDNTTGDTITKIPYNGDTSALSISLAGEPFNADGFITGVTSIGSKLYILGTDSPSGGAILQVNVAPPLDAAHPFKIIVNGDNSFWQAGSSAVSPNGLTTDGTGLIAWASGQLFYITLTGTLKRIAGDSSFISASNIDDNLPSYDYNTAKDATSTDPIHEPLLIYRNQQQQADSDVFLGYRATDATHGKLLFVGSWNDLDFVGTFVEGLDCQVYP